MDILKAKVEQLENQLSTVSNERIGHIEAKLEKVYKKVEKMHKQGRKTKKMLAKLKSSPTAHLEYAANEQQDSANKLKLQKIKESAQKFISSLSVYGIPRIAKTNNVVVKLLWIVMLLISVSYGFYIISRSINDYNQFDVITNVERILPESVTFPAITICKKDYFKMLTRPEIDFFFINNKSIDSILTDVKFKDKSIGVGDGIDFFKIPKSFGDCVRFNGPTNQDFKTSESKTDALFLELATFSSESTNIYRIFQEVEVYVTDNYLNSFLNSDHIHLVTHKFESEYDYLMSLIKAESETKLGEPYNNCTESKDVTYRQMNCIEKCINKEIKETYNCSIPSYYRIGGLEECGGVLQAHQIYGTEYNYHFFINSYYENHITFIGNLTNEFKTVCEKECPRECETTLFHKQVVTSTESGYNSRLTFSFSDFSTLNIRQIPKMSPFDLVSNVGGLLGLFIGVSFLSFVEVIEFFIDIFFVIFI